MIYYKNLIGSHVYGYDETDATQEPYIQRAIDNGWEDITESWPPPPLPIVEVNKPQPTVVELMEQLRAIQAQIEALV